MGMIESVEIETLRRNIRYSRSPLSQHLPKPPGRSCILRKFHRVTDDSNRLGDVLLEIESYGIIDNFVV